MLAITNVKIHPITSPDIESGTVLVKNGKILGFGSSNSVEIPEEFETFDGEGLKLFPGFIDSHCHLGMTETGGMGSHTNEISSPLTPCMYAADAILPDEEFVYRAHQNAGITTVLSTPGSANVIGGTSTAFKTIPTVDIDEVIIKNPVHLKIALGENPARVYGGKGVAPASKMGVAHMLRSQFRKAQTYLERKEKASREDKEFDIQEDMEVLGQVLNRTLNVEAHAHNYEDMLTAIRIKEEFGIRLHIVHGTEAFKIIEQLRKHNIAITFSPQLSVASKKENRFKTLRSAAMMAKAGLLFAISTDHPVYPIDLLLIDAALSMREGLSLQQTLESITINAAKILGLENRIGSIEVGKDADLVLWKDHPILHTQAKVQRVMINGEWIYTGQKSHGQFESYVRSFE